MTIDLAKRVVALKPSASIVAKQKVTELQAAGKRVIDLTIGEPDLDTPGHIIDAAMEALRNGDTHYTATVGTPELREAIITKLRRDNGLEYTAKEIVVGNGANQLIFEALAASLNEGDGRGQHS